MKVVAEANEPKDPNSLHIVSWNTLADRYIYFQQHGRPGEDWKVFDQNHRHRFYLEWSYGTLLTLAF